MNLRNIALTSVLVLGMTAMASAGTITTGTGTSVSNAVVSGCLQTWSNSADVYETQSLNISGSAQLVASEAGAHTDNGNHKDNGNGSQNGTLQGDASISVSETVLVGADNSGSRFEGSETSTTSTTSSDAFYSVSGQ